MSACQRHGVEDCRSFSCGGRGTNSGGGGGVSGNGGDPTSYAASNHALSEGATSQGRPIAEDASINKADEDMQDVAWIKRRERNDLAKAAMVANIRTLGTPFYRSVATDIRILAEASYAYADAMLAASGDYDDK